MKKHQIYTCVGILLLILFFFTLCRQKNEYYDLQLNRTSIKQLSGPTSVSAVKPKTISYAEWKKKGVFLPTILFLNTDNRDTNGQCMDCNPSNGCYPAYSPDFFKILKGINNVDIYTQLPLMTQEYKDTILSPSPPGSEHDINYIYTEKNKICYAPDVNEEVYNRDCMDTNARWHSVGVTSEGNTESSYEFGAVNYTVDMLLYFAGCTSVNDFSLGLLEANNFLQQPDQQVLLDCILYVLDLFGKAVDLYTPLSQTEFISSFLPLSSENVYKDTSILYTQFEQLHPELKGILKPSMYAYYLDIVLPYNKKEIQSYTTYTSDNVIYIQNYIRILRDSLRAGTMDVSIINQYVNAAQDGVIRNIFSRLFRPIRQMLNELYFILNVFSNPNESFLSIYLVPQGHQTRLYDYFTKNTAMKKWYNPFIRPVLSGENYRCVDLSKINAILQQVLPSSPSSPLPASPRIDTDTGSKINTNVSVLSKKKPIPIGGESVVSSSLGHVKRKQSSALLYVILILIICVIITIVVQKYESA